MKFEGGHDAQVWTMLAAAALHAWITRGQQPGPAVKLAAENADQMLAQFKAREPERQ